MITPTDHMSELQLTGSKLITFRKHTQSEMIPNISNCHTSGDTKSGVPCITQISLESLSLLARPKSTSLMLKLLPVSHTMFSGLISRWTMFWE